MWRAQAKAGPRLLPSGQPINTLKIAKNIRNYPRKGPGRQNALLSLTPFRRFLRSFCGKASGRRAGRRPFLGHMSQGAPLCMTTCHSSQKKAPAKSLHREESLSGKAPRPRRTPAQNNARQRGAVQNPSPRLEGSASILLYFNAAEKAAFLLPAALLFSVDSGGGVVYSRNAVWLSCRWRGRLFRALPKQVPGGRTTRLFSILLYIL